MVVVAAGGVGAGDHRARDRGVGTDRSRAVLWGSESRSAQSGAKGAGGAGARRGVGVSWPADRAFATCLPRPWTRAPTRPTRLGAAGRPAVPSESAPPRRRH